MVRFVALLCTLAAVPAVVAGTAGGNAGGSDRALLARHVPVLVLHPAEQLAPVAVDGFLADSDLTVRGADGAWEPSSAPLGEAPREARLDHRACSAIDGRVRVSAGAGARG